MKARLATINLEVASPETSKRFYIDVLGMVEDERRSHPPNFVYLSSAGCDLTIANTRGDRAVEASATSTIELGFEVDAIAEAKAHLERLGLVDYREESMGWGQAIELRDPDGHRVLIYAFARG